MTFIKKLELFHVKHYIYKLIILSITLIAFNSSTSVHPIHISVTKVDYKTKQQRLEISIKVFANDLEDGIEDLTNNPIHLNIEKESENADKKIADYLDYNFVIHTSRNEKLPLTFIGKEYKEDAIWCYLEGEILPSSKSLSITNSILNPYFEDQQNFIHFYKDKMRTKSIILKNNKIEAQINL